MLNNILNMFQNKNNNIINNIYKLQQDIKNSGLTPEEYVVNILKKNNKKIDINKMEEFKIFVKQFGITDDQINNFMNNFEKK